MTGLFEPSSFALEKGQSFCSKSLDDQTGVGGTWKRLPIGKRSTYHPSFPIRPRRPRVDIHYGKRNVFGVLVDASNRQEFGNL